MHGASATPEYGHEEGSVVELGVFVAKSPVDVDMLVMSAIDVDVLVRVVVAVVVAGRVVSVS
jgi:hypothetical protein